MNRRLLKPHRSIRTGAPCRITVLLAVACLYTLCHPVAAREVPITILHTTEVRGHILSLRYREWDRYHGGLLRCASAVDRVRAEEEHVLLVDTGGWLGGGPESYLSRGMLPLRAAALMAYDARVVDCEEALSDLSALDGAFDLVRVPRLTMDQPTVAAYEDPPLPFLTVVREGVSVAMIGLSGCRDAETLQDRETGGPGHVPARMDKVMADVRARRPEIVILLAHLSYTPWAPEKENLLRNIMERYQDVDVVLGGGSGKVVRSGELGGTLYSEAGSDARWLGRVDLVYDTVRRQLVSRKADVIEIGPDVAIHEPLRRNLGSSLGRIERTLDRVVGDTARRIGSSSSTPGQSDMQELIGRALAEACDADVVLSRGEGLGGFSVGPVRYRDLLRAVPEQTHVACVEVTPVDLRRILVENMGHVDTSGFLGIHGAHYTWNASRSGGDEVENLLLAHGGRPHGRKRLRVVFDSGLLDRQARGREVLKAIARAPESRLDVRAVDVRSCVAEYMSRHGLDTIRRSRGYEVVEPTARGTPAAGSRHAACSAGMMLP